MEAHKLEEDSAGLGALDTPATSDAAAIMLCTFGNKLQDASFQILKQVYLSPSESPYHRVVPGEKHKEKVGSQEKILKEFSVAGY